MATATIASETVTAARPNTLRPPRGELTRRELLAGAGAAALFLELRGRIPFAQDIMLARMHVAGTYYYEAEEVAEGLSPGQRFGLRREPENAYDEFAIEVLTPEGRKLGYLPRRYNEIPAQLMDAGKRLFVQMESIERRGGWLDIRLSLYMEDD